MKCLAKIMKGFILFFTGWYVEPEGEDGARDQGESHPAKNHLEPGQGKLQASGRRRIADELLLDKNWHMTEHLKWRSVVWQVLKSMLHQAFHVCVDSDTKDSFFWLAQKVLFVITLCRIPPYVWPNIISNTLTDRLLIFQLKNYCMSRSASPLITYFCD